MKLFFILLILFLLTPITQGSQTKPVRLIYQDTECAPYEIGSGPLVPASKPGIAVELLIKVSRKLSIPFSFSRMPWKRCLLELAENKVDGLFSASYRSKRLKNGVYPTKNGVADPDKRIYTNAYHLFKLKSSKVNWDGRKFTRIEGLIGATLGYSIVDDLKKMGYKVHEEKETFRNFRMLKDGYISAVVDFGRYGEKILRRYPYIFSEIIMVKPPVAEKHYYLMLSHNFVGNNPVLAEKIWNTIRNIRIKHLKEISLKYF